MNKDGQGDMRSKENMLKIEEVENYIRAHKDWKRVCYSDLEVDGEAVCSEQKSLISPLIFLKMFGKRDEKGQVLSVSEHEQADIIDAWNKF